MTRRKYQDRSGRWRDAKGRFTSPPSKKRPPKKPPKPRKKHPPYDPNIEAPRPCALGWCDRFGRAVRRPNIAIVAKFIADFAHGKVEWTRLPNKDEPRAATGLHALVNDFTVPVDAYFGADMLRGAGDLADDRIALVGLWWYIVDRDGDVLENRWTTFTAKDQLHTALYETAKSLEQLERDLQKTPTGGNVFISGVTIRTYYDGAPITIRRP